MTDATTAARRGHRKGQGPFRCLRCPGWAWAVVLLLLSPAVVRGQSAPADSAAVATPSSRTLFLADIQLAGATRTPLATVYRFLPLRPGQPVDQRLLVEGVDALRASGLFRTVSFYTRPGAVRGQLILVLDVTEHGLDFRWAAGNTNLDGWYLVPAMVSYDNAFGRGGFFDLQWRFGFHHSGLLWRYGDTRAGDGDSYWSTRLGIVSTERPYFSDGVEFRHEVRTAGLATVFGRRVGSDRVVEVGVNLEGIDVARHSVAYSQSQDGTIEFDQEIPERDLPPAIRAVVGKGSRAIFHLDWQRDTRAAETRAGSPVAGIWGRLKGHVVAQEHHSHVGVQADLRSFDEVPGGVLAARLRGAWVGRSAAFYDRLYLGGMYTVRGFPTHALSAPGGDTWLWSGSLEYRSCILRDARGTKLAGVLFVDAGASGSSDADDPYGGVAVGTGYGVRLRVWWLDWIGVDFGFPLTDRPLDQGFQGTASIGWSF